MTLFRTAFLTISCLAFIFMTSPVQAAEINAAGAAKLKTMFEGIIKNASESPNLNEQGAKLQYDGTVSVEPATTYYAVTLPHARMIYPDGRTLEIGMISINASEHDAPTRWKMAIAVPTPIVMFDAAKNQVGRASIGGQQAVGIWDEKMNYFSKLDATYTNLKLESTAPVYTLNVPSVQIRYDFTEAGKGLWSGPGDVKITGVNFDSPELNASGTIQEIMSNFTLDQYNPVAAKAHRQKMQQATGPASKKIFDTLTSAGNGITTQYTMTGVNLKRKDPATGVESTIKVARAKMGVQTAGFLTGDTVSLALNFGYDGYSLTPVPPGFEGLQPTKANLDIKLESLPYRQLSELVSNTLAGVDTQPQMAGLSLVMKVPAILSQSGSHMTIKDTYVGNDEYMIDLNGHVRADITALNSMTAEAKAKFKNLDAVLAHAKAGAIMQNNMHAMEFQQMIATLETLKRIGRVENIPGQPPVYIFDFVMNPQGQMLMNGKDLMTTLMTGGAPVQSAPAATAVPVPPVEAVP